MSNVQIKWEQDRSWGPNVKVTSAVYYWCGYPIPREAALLTKLREQYPGGTHYEIVYMNIDEMFDWIFKERATMTERLFRVELRVDILDDESYEKFKHLVLLNSRSCFANAVLLNQSPVKPTIAIITNDGFIGQKDIEQFEDLMAPNGLGAVDTGEEPVSSELLSAIANRTAEKNTP